MTEYLGPRVALKREADELDRIVVEADSVAQRTEKPQGVIGLTEEIHLLAVVVRDLAKLARRQVQAW